MRMENVVTVNYMLDLLKKLSDGGYGDMKIKCMDNDLHEDEISINYITNEILFRGYLFNYSLTDKVKQFCNDMEKARERFYMNKESEIEE